MNHRALVLLWVLAAACGKPPPPPPPPPPTPQQRIDASKSRLQRLAEEQLQAAPQDARLQLWVAAFRGKDTPDGLRALPPGPLAATVLCAWETSEAAVKALEDVAPTSRASLFRAKAILRTARTDPAFWKPLTEAVEEALQRDRWDCPVRAFDAWWIGWLEANEPDAFARLCYRSRYAGSAGVALAELTGVVEGAAYAPAPPRHELKRLADAVGKLLQNRLQSPDAVEAAAAHDAMRDFLAAKFVLAWRAGTLDPAREAGLALEEWGRRDVALGRRGRADETLTKLFASGALRPPFGPAATAEEADDAWAKEAAKEVEKEAKSIFAAWKAAAVRSAPFVEEIAGRRPARSPYENYLGQTLRDRDFLFTDAYPKDRMSQILDAAFKGESVYNPQAQGTEAFAWIVRDNLRRPGTVPSAQVERRFSRKEEAAERAAEDMNVFAVLAARKEAVAAERRPSPADVRKAGPSASALQGYAWQLQEVVKAKAVDALAWLPEAGGGAPSAAEILIAETLRGATGQDLGPDWARWRSFLESGK